MTVETETDAAVRFFHHVPSNINIDTLWTASILSIPGIRRTRRNNDTRG